MGRFRKNLFLGIVIIVSSITGYFLQKNEQRSYILETESWAGTNITFSPGLTGYDLDDTDGDTENTKKSDKININTATQTELETLPGIGEKRAQQIILYREKQRNFEVIEDIMKIPGIGTKIFEELKNKITV